MVLICADDPPPRRVFCFGRYPAVEAHSDQRIRRQRLGGQAEPCPLAIGKILGCFLGFEQVLGHRAVFGNQHGPLAAIDARTSLGSSATMIVLR